MSERPATLHERILTEVRENIVSGTWPPGHRIPFEVEMAAAYGVSRMTVNKALTQLTQRMERATAEGDIARWNPVATRVEPEAVPAYARQYPLWKGLYLATRDIAHGLS